MTYIQWVSLCHIVNHIVSHRQLSHVLELRGCAFLLTVNYTLNFGKTLSIFNKNTTQYDKD